MKTVSQAEKEANLGNPETALHAAATAQKAVTDWCGYEATVRAVLRKYNAGEYDPYEALKHISEATGIFTGRGFEL